MEGVWERLRLIDVSYLISVTVGYVIDIVNVILQ